MSRLDRNLKGQDKADIQKNLDLLESQLERLTVSEETSHIARKRVVCNVGFLLFAGIVLVYNILFSITGNSALIRTAVVQIPMALFAVIWLWKGRIWWPLYSYHVLAFMLIIDTAIAIFAGQGTLLKTHFYYLFFTVGVSVIIPSNSPRLTWSLMVTTLIAFLCLEFYGVDAHPDIAAMSTSTIKWFQILVFLTMALCVGAAVYFADWSSFILEERLIKLASQDFLTGLPNRRAFHHMLDDKRILNKNANDSYCICILDIDHFKKVNDSYGHDTGDEVLKFVAQHLKKSVRIGDFVARLGGEEFVLVMPKTLLKDGVVVAERLREAIAKCAFVGYWGSINITISLGVVQYFQGSTDSQLIDLADQALYRAKQNGRNKLEIVEPPAFA